jgi:hypothetical protein
MRVFLNFAHEDLLHSWTTACQFFDLYVVTTVVMQNPSKNIAMKGRKNLGKPEKYM